MVPRVGLEPTRPFGQRLLKPPRLPISPPGQGDVECVVPEGGLEPPRPLGHSTLDAARLPVPPLGQRKKKMVGATGFEPATPWPQTRRSARLSYAPTKKGKSPGVPSDRRRLRFNVRRRQVTGLLHSARLCGRFLPRGAQRGYEETAWLEHATAAKPGTGRRLGAPG